MSIYAVVEEVARWQRCGDPLEGTEKVEVSDGDQFLHYFLRSDPTSRDTGLVPASLVSLPSLLRYPSAAQTAKASPPPATPCYCQSVLIQPIADLLPTILVYVRSRFRRGRTFKIRRWFVVLGVVGRVQDGALGLAGWW
jgi:hypothetical protein